MLPENLSRVNGQFLQQLCEDRCPESETLDFKRELPSNSERDKQELLKDVCALANANGGDLVYGIVEVDGAASSIKAITTESSDSAKRRISQVLDAGLEPRLRGVRLTHVEVPGGYVVVARVPASYDLPHCIRANGNRRFVVRNGTSTTDMTYEQIRLAFDRTATLAERASRFVATRLEMIAKRNTPTPLEQGPVCVVHVVPLAGIAERKSVDLREIYARSFSTFMGRRWGSGDRTFNFDGLAVHPGGAHDKGYFAYNHIFRTGAFEGAQLVGAKRAIERDGPDRSLVWSSEMSDFVHHSTTTYITAATSWGYGGPALLGIALLNVEGFELATEDAFFPFNRITGGDRPHFVPPQTWIDDLGAVSIDDIVRPSLDILWQSFGFERCSEFDENTGAYRGRRR